MKVTTKSRLIKPQEWGDGWGNGFYNVPGFCTARHPKEAIQGIFLWYEVCNSLG
jgi:hypothetical protein